MVLRPSRWERGPEAHCLQMGSGYSRYLDRVWSSCRPGPVRWSGSPKETCRGSEAERSSTGQHGSTRSALSLPDTRLMARLEATFKRSRPVFLRRLRRPAWFLAKRQCAAKTPFSGVQATHGCSFRFMAEMASLFRHLRLETSRFNGAMTADTSIPSTMSAEPGHQDPISSAWIW